MPITPAPTIIMATQLKSVDNIPQKIIIPESMFLPSDIRTPIILDGELSLSCMMEGLF